MDATDADERQRLVAGITRWLVVIGRRDQLTVDWQRPAPTPGHAPRRATGAAPPPATPPAPNHQPRRRRRVTDTLLLAGAGALVILVHLGLVGGALVASVWARWGADLVLALVVAKVLVVGGHLVLGRFVFRRSPALAAALGQRPWRGAGSHETQTRNEPEESS